MPESDVRARNRRGRPRASPQINCMSKMRYQQLPYFSRRMHARGRKLILNASNSSGRVAPSNTRSTLRSHLGCNRSYSSTSTNLQPGGNDRGNTSFTPSRAFPQYSIYGDDALLTVKPLLPTFKLAASNGVALDRKGKIMMVFTPRTPPTGSSTGAQAAAAGGFRWQEQITIALTVEEVGLLVNQLPSYEVEVCRDGPRPGSAVEEGTGNMEYGMNRFSAAQISDAPDKVLTVTPGDGATVSFKIDFVRDGVGGQISPVDDNSHNAPLEVVAQAGEFEVVKRILESSVPYLLGWTTMMDIGVASMMRIGFNGGENH